MFCQTETEHRARFSITQTLIEYFFKSTNFFFEDLSETRIVEEYGKINKHRAGKKLLFIR